MSKEFDVYLNKRLTECDIIVYSMPYRDGLAVANCLILESYLKCCILQKFIAVKTNFNLISHIDKMSKICYEQLEISATIGVSAREKVYCNIFPSLLFIGLAVKNRLSTLSTMFAGGKTASQLIAEVKGATLCCSLGNIRLSIGTSANLFENVTKRESAKFGLPIMAKIVKRQSIGSVHDKVAISASADAILKRYRMLEEMDELPLISYDDMALDNVDYVVL